MARLIPPQTTPSFLSRSARYIELGAKLSSALMSLRDRPRALDWAALSTQLVALSLQLAHERQRTLARCPWDYFDDDGANSPWLEVPESLSALVLAHAQNVHVERKHWDGEPGSNRVVLAEIGGHRVGWISNGTGELCDGPYLWRASQQQAYEALGQRIWARLGRSRLALTPTGLQDDPFAAKQPFASASARRVCERLRAFTAGGHHRSAIFIGQPGTGKSTLIRSIADMLGYRSLRIDVSTLVRPPGDRQDRSGANVVDDLAGLVVVLRPELLILDDIDRIGQHPGLLDFLELAKLHVRLVLASANDAARISSAALRPGRFDEVQIVEGIEREFLQAELGEADGDLVETMRDWPVAYLQEYLVRRSQLGRAQARRELAQLKQRLQNNRDEEGDDSD